MLAIIPARSGSKGLPGKNIKKLHGKPMIAYTIQAALKSKYIDNVIVSTDSIEIETIAKNFGAKSYFLRPKLLASDEANAIDNYIFTINKLNNDFNYKIDDFVVLQPTSPLRVTKDIDSAIDIFYTKKADSVISYSEESHPLKWHKYISKDGRFENIFDDSLLNRQEFRTSFYPNGAIYVFKYRLIKRKMYYSNNSFAYIMPRSRSVDVDTFDDFQYIEFLMSKFNDRKS
jgi:N-acylneuraminate cytidylyltransferase/CMP-N,N'-diacetyllegionaminic acid synthase